jgi:hypothetical protein
VVTSDIWQLAMSDKWRFATDEQHGLLKSMVFAAEFGYAKNRAF